MSFPENSRKVFWFSDKDYSQIFPENFYLRNFDFNVFFDVKQISDFPDFFESLTEFLIFADYSLLKYEIFENSFFKWLKKTEKRIVLLVQENDISIFFEKNVPLTKFAILPLHKYGLFENRPEKNSSSILIENKNSKIMSNLFPSVLEKFVGRTPEIYSFKKKILEIAPLDLTVLLSGENGTGKTFLANVIHELSSRREKTFYALNMAEIPENLGESYLFGSVEGAFTGAKNSKGCFEAADGGTLFLDEIAELSLLLQSKLLRVLETGKFRPVGSTKEKECDVRILCATNKNLKELVEKGLFREDLYYRIVDFELYLQPLRNRLDDLPLFVEIFLENSGKILSSGALQKMKNYNWPGNIRQLKKCLNRAKVLCQDDEITEDEIIF